MRVLLDHCVPRRFGRLLVAHEVRTVYTMGWSSLSNGALLSEARGSFDAFLTVDQNIQFQRYLSTLPLPVMVLVAPNNRFETLAPYADTVNNCLARPLARELILIEGPDKVRHVRAPDL